jgi:hypothetical protein
VVLVDLQPQVGGLVEAGHDLARGHRRQCHCSNSWRRYREIIFGRNLQIRIR